MAKKIAPLSEEVLKPSDAPKTLMGHPFYGLVLDEKQEAFRDAIWNPEKLVVFVDSVAGSGKTLIAAATANLLVRYGFYDGIVFISTPVQEEKLGYMPGTLEEKTSIYNEPFYQALYKLNINPNVCVSNASIMNQKNGTAFIDITTHVFLRGQNFENKVVLIDEAQNMYEDELRKVLTRMHDNCKVIVTGHAGQIDLIHHPERSGFRRCIEHFKGDDRAAICTLEKNYRGWISTHADKAWDELEK